MCWRWRPPIPRSNETVAALASTLAKSSVKNLKRLYPGARRGCEHVAGDAPVNPAFPILTDFSPKEFQPIFAYQMVAYIVQ